MQNLRHWRKKLQFCMRKMKQRDDKNANTLAVGEKVNAPVCGAGRGIHGEMGRDSMMNRSYLSDLFCVRIMRIR